LDLIKDMPYKEREINKLYYSIGEVSVMLDVNASLIRFWEKEFDLIQPRKNKKGNRMFSSEDIINLKMIQHLVKEKGYTLQGAREYLKTNQARESDKHRIINALTQLKSFLLEFKESL